MKVYFIEPLQHVLKLKVDMLTVSSFDSYTVHLNIRTNRIKNKIRSIISLYQLKEKIVEYK